ncbi:MAG: response regulator transcription factor [Anaerolineae bacterium]|nr:response regulator transcription factor [Anaerolineae bacterium]
MKRSSILLCDDHELFRAGLAGLVNAQADLEVVGQASDGLEAFALARALHPELIVMDIKMPICDGLESTRLICAEIPGARILMLTVHDEDDKLFEAIKAGASGYLLKNTNAAEFLRSVRHVLAGDAALPPRLAARLVDEFARISRTSPGAAPETDSSDLSPRERQVLNLVAAGASDKEIAAQLSLSVYTVKSHVRSILSKLHAVNRRHAARLAAQGGLVANG